MNSPAAERSYSLRARAVGFAERLLLHFEAPRAAKHANSIFIWIPKNAGTSVYSMLRLSGLVKLKTPSAVERFFGNSGRVTFGHMAIEPLVERGLVSRAFVDSAFKFAIVRDPYARAASLYRFMSKIGQFEGSEGETGFTQFLHRLAERPIDPIGPYNYRRLSQCNPQVDWLRDTAADAIYRVEDLDGFVADISERWAIPKKSIPHRNQSEKAEDLNLTAEQRSLIEHFYAEDFATLGYAKR
jgi:hypothetical protein